MIWWCKLTGGLDEPLDHFEQLLLTDHSYNLFMCKIVSHQWQIKCKLSPDVLKQLLINTQAKEECPIGG